MPDETPPVDRAPSTEEEIRAARIGPPTLLDGRVHLAKYDPAWPRLFQREADRIRRALGEWALRVEHTGSTSVSGLAADAKTAVVEAIIARARAARYAQ
jgi:GrpB-like predicted nucleotidyltransferase (UPF0157 family)